MCHGQPDLVIVCMIEIILDVIVNIKMLIFICPYDSFLD